MTIKKEVLVNNHERRTFLTTMRAGMTVLGLAAAAVAVPAATAQSSVDSRWQPGRHMLDDWFDQVPGQHRLVFDTTTAEGASSAAIYAGNFFTANNTGYGLQNADLAVVIVMRHNSTPFAYSDAMWAKYGIPISKQSNFLDPATKEAPKGNVYTRQLTGLVNRGVHLAVCQMATRLYAGSIARAVGSTADDIYNELVSNLIPNSHMVPAGIVAVSRAQERGYTFCNAT
jgi:intracellular sulfur oxidation DsrE/DsrF family protein